MRVLAMRLEPPEIELQMLDGADPIPVGITALIANPAGQPVFWQLATCQQAASTGCESLPDEDDSSSRLHEHVGSGKSDPPPVGDAPQVVVMDEYSFSSDLVLRLLEDSAIDGLIGSRPLFDLLAVSGDESERALKRLQVSLPDIAYRMLLFEAGIPICDNSGAPPGCMEYRTRVANTNPVIEEVSYQRVVGGRTPSSPRPMPLDSPLLVRPGEKIWLWPSASEDSIESYQTLTVDFEDQSVRVEDRTEILVWSWFATSGSFGRARTEETRTRGEQNSWTAPSDLAESAEDVWIWLVLRDNRGGVDFTTLHLRMDAGD